MAASNFLADLNEFFGSGRRGTRVKPQPTTKVVAIIDGEEQTIAKGRDGLWSVRYQGETHRNSKLGDLIHQIESDFGGTVERVSA